MEGSSTQISVQPAATRASSSARTMGRRASVRAQRSRPSRRPERCRGRDGGLEWGGRGVGEAARRRNSSTTPRPRGARRGPVTGVCRAGRGRAGRSGGGVGFPGRCLRCSRRSERLKSRRVCSPSVMTSRPARVWSWRAAMTASSWSSARSSGPNSVELLGGEFEPAGEGVEPMTEVRAGTSDGC
jgi:hypothetical protein